MSAPSWLRWVLAAAMIAVALYHLVRLLSYRALRRPVRPDVELTHVALGLAMTLMLVGTLAPANSRALALLFAGPTLWFVARAIHGYVMDGTGALMTSVNRSSVARRRCTCSPCWRSTGPAQAWAACRSRVGLPATCSSRHCRCATRSSSPPYSC